MCFLAFLAGLRLESNLRLLDRLQLVDQLRSRRSFFVRVGVPALASVRLLEWWPSLSPPGRSAWLRLRA
jgi:hypothetical protein